MKSFKFFITKLGFFTAIVFFALAFQPVQAQISFDDDVDDQTPAAPIDGLLGLGIAAGAWYGIKKLKGKN